MSNNHPHLLWIALCAHGMAIAGGLPTQFERFGYTGTSQSTGSYGSAVVAIGDSMGNQGMAVGGPMTPVSGFGAVDRWFDTGTGWQRASVVTRPPMAPNGHHFGGSLASFGTRLFGTADNPPTAYVFDIQPGNQLEATLTQTLQPQLLGTAGLSTGLNIGSFADYLAVSVLRNYQDSGSVELFRFSAGQWTSTGQVLTDSRQFRSAGFGQGLAMTEDRLFIGVPQLDPQTTPPGVEVREYRRPVSGNQWSFVTSHDLSGFAVPQNQPNPRLGYSIAVHGNTLVAGAPQLADANGDAVGAVLVWRYDANQDSWLPEAALFNPDLQVDSQFGAAVATNGDQILVGAPTSNALDGRAYRFQRDNGGQWQAKIRLSSLAIGLHRFGQSVAFADDGSHLVGAPGYGGGDGALYVFEGDRLLQDGFE
ncbi:MAG: hypothetical protein R3F15_12960 [Lysobacterales bacterium]